MLDFAKELAERVGFEPTVRDYRTPDFESGTFDHSATSPCTFQCLPGPWPEPDNSPQI